MPSRFRSRTDALLEAVGQGRKVPPPESVRVLVHMLGVGFRKRGWEVVQAFDAMQAVMYAKRAPLPDAIVLDLGMPGGTGYGVLERLSRSTITSTIPVVVVTGSPDPGAEDRARESGAVGFLPKPLEPAALIAEVAGVGEA